MPYLNSRLCALLAMGLSLVAVPGLRSQEASSAAAPAAIRGDVNGDGRVTRADADAVRTWLVRGTLPDGRSILPAGDANGDGQVTAADAALISRFAAGVDVSRFPVGRPVSAGGERMSGSTLVSTEYECRADFRSGNLACAVVSPGGENGARLDLMLYKDAAKIVNAGGGAYSGGNKSNPDTMTYNLSLLNLIPQPIGTTDGVTPDTSRLVITSFRLTSPQPTATAQLDNAEGTATFVDSLRSAPDTTYTDAPYMNYPGLLAQNDTSSAKLLRFVFSPTVTAMAFTYRIWTRVQYLHGYIVVTPDTVPILEPAQTAQLTGTVYDQLGVLQSDPIDWTTSDPAVATVSSSGLVTAVADGTATITATSTIDARRTESRVVTVDAAPTVTATVPTNGAINVAATANIVITFSEAVDVTGASFTLECPTPTAQAFTVSGSGTSAIELNPDADLPAGETCTVKVVAAQVSDADGVDGPNTLAADYTFSFAVAVTANADVLADTVVGNVPVNTANTSVPFSVTANDQLSPGATITFAGWNSVAGKTQQNGDVVITPSGAGRGQFTYDPPAGFEGTDSFQYTIQSGSATSTATVTLTVDKMIWFVRAGATAECDTQCGRMSSPFKALATFNTANNAGGSSNPENAEPVFVHEGTYTGPVTLRAGQALIGQDANATLAALADVKFPSMTGVPSTNGGDAGKVTISGSDGINLAQNNAVYGLTLETAAPGEAIGGSNFGTLTLANGTSHAADVTITSTGQALGLNTGTVSGVLASVGSTGGTNNVNLTAVNTTGTVSLGGGALSGASGDGFLVNNGSGSFTYSGTISNSTSRAVNINGKTGGTVTFSGAINPSAPVGGAAGINLTSNPGATIAFNGGVTLSTTTSVPFTATGGGTVEVTGASNTISVTGAAPRAVQLSGITIGAGGMAFSTISSTGITTATAFSAINVGGGSFTAGSLSVTGTTNAGSRGLDLTTNSAQFTFTTASVNGTSGEGIYLNGNTGAVAVSGGTVGTTAGDALFVSGGNAGVTVAASLAKTTAGRIANIASRTGGTTTISGSINCTAACTGILGNANAGTINFTHATQTLNTGASGAVTLTNNTGTINFTGGSLDIDVTSGAGLTATGGGTINVAGAANTVSSTGGGTAVNIQNTTIGGSGVTFYSVNATGGGSNGIVLANTGAGAFQVTGDGASDAANTARGRTTAKSGGGTVALGSGGTISGKSGDGVSLSTTGAVTLRNMVIQSGSSDGIDASTVGGLTVDNTQITGQASGHGIRGIILSGLTLTHSDVGNNATAAGVDASDTWNLRFLGLTGTATVQNSLIHHSAETVFGVINTSGSLTLGITNTNITDTYPVGGVVTNPPGTNGLQINAYGSANINATLTNDSIARTRARGITASTETGGSGVLSLTVTGTKFVDNVTVGLEIAHGSSGAATYNFNGNDFQRHGSIPINVNRLGSSTFSAFGDFTGTIQSNTIGTPGILNSGTSTSSDGIHVESNGTGGNTRVAIVNNTIRQVGQYGIFLGIVDTKIGGATQPALEARVQGNNVGEIKSTGLDGLRVVPGAVSGDHGRVCLDVISNTLAGSTGAGPAYGWRIRTAALLAPAVNPAPTIQLEGWNGADPFATYAVNRPNTLSGVSGTATESHAAGTVVAVANCNTP